MSNRVKKYLHNNQQIEIPGLGNLTMQSVNQYLSDSDSIIHPPVQKIRFEEYNNDSNRNSVLKKYYRDSSTMKKVKKQLNQTTNEILNFGESNISGLGRLFRDQNGQLQFTAKNLVNSEVKFLPIIDLKNLGISNNSTLSLNSSSQLISTSNGRTQSPNGNSVDVNKNNISIMSNSVDSVQREAFKTPWLSYIFLLSVVVISAFILLISWNEVGGDAIEVGSNVLGTVNNGGVKIGLLKGFLY